jgi:hypothetical protein
LGDLDFIRIFLRAPEKNAGHDELSYTVSDAHAPGPESPRVADCERGEAGDQVPSRSRCHRPGQEAAGCENSEAEGDLPHGGQHPYAARNEADKNNRDQSAGSYGGQELLDRHEDHLVGKPGVYATRPGQRLHTDERRRDNCRRHPYAQVGCDVGCRIGNKVVLRNRSDDREDSGNRKRCGAIPAELRSARNLAPDAGDIAERLVEWVEREANLELTLHCKVSQLRRAVKLRGGFRAEKVNSSVLNRDRSGNRRASNSTCVTATPARIPARAV